MKKLGLFIICILLAISASACGAKTQSNTSGEPAKTESNSGATENSSQASQGENSQKEDTKKEDTKADKNSADNNNSQKSDLAKKVDEFNDPNTPEERKEEIRKELEALFEKAEEESKNK